MRMNLKIELLCYLLLFHAFLSESIFAQTTKEIANQQAEWLMYSGAHKITDNTSIFTEYQWRSYALFEEIQQVYLGAGLLQKMKNDMVLGVGFNWLNFRPYGSQPIPSDFNEYRGWQQIEMQQSVKRVSLRHRYRLEQRFLENKLLTGSENYISNGYDLRLRARYRMAVVVPINTSEMELNTLFASVSNEIFVGIGKGHNFNVFDQNRLLLMLGWNVFKNGNIQLGYMNHYIIKPNGYQHERNHTLMLVLNYGLDLRKK